MTDFVETMKLVEKAQEDIYFARIDRELIEELHRQAAAAQKAAARGAVMAEKSAPARQVSTN